MAGEKTTKDKEFFPEKKQLDPKIYAYELPNIKDHNWLIKIGYTTQSVKERIDQQTKTAGMKYKILLEESAIRTDGSVFSDHDIHKLLKDEWIHNPKGERFECSIHQIKWAITAIRERKNIISKRTRTFPMRPEQKAAVEKTVAYFQNEKKSNTKSIPRFLRNAKMRFWKTFTSYQLALKMWWRKVLVLTFKPAVEKAREEDLLNHKDFENRQFISKNKANTQDVDKKKPFVCFWSFQDFLGKNEIWKIKTNNERVHETNRDVVIFDEYHYGARRENAKSLFEDGDEQIDKIWLSAFETIESINEISEILPITTNHYLYLSGTPFRAIRSWEFIEEQIFNRTYSDEQKAKEGWDQKDGENPYLSLPKMIMMTYQLPEHIIQVTNGWEFNEFDLNEFFSAKYDKEDKEWIEKASFKYKDQVQKWLDLIRGQLPETTIDELKLGAKKPALPYSDSRLLNLLTHTFWYLPDVASCYAMRNLLHEKQNKFYQDYKVILVAGKKVGDGVKALKPVNEAMWNPLKTKTITLSCGKLTTGVSVKPRSGVFMLRNLKSPETYFQTAFRVQTPREITNPDDKSPNKKTVIKNCCYIFDFAPNRALQQIADYSNKLSPDEQNPEKKVKEFIQFLPVLSYDGSSMKEIDATGILDIVTSGTTATLLARRRESALLVNVDTFTLEKLLDNPKAMNALMKIEWFRSLNTDLQTIINKSNAIKKAKQESSDSNKEINKELRKKIDNDEKEVKSKRKQIQEKLIKFATRIPVFMYLTDNREYCLKDVITQLEPQLFKKVTGLTVQDFELLVSLNIFNSTLMNDAVYKFKRYEDASLEYTGINRHEWENIGWFDNKKTREEFYNS